MDLKWNKNGAKGSECGETITLVSDCHRSWLASDTYCNNERPSSLPTRHAGHSQLVLVLPSRHGDFQTVLEKDRRINQKNNGKLNQNFLLLEIHKTLPILSNILDGNSNTFWLDPLSNMTRPGTVEFELYYLLAKSDLAERRC